MAEEREVVTLQWEGAVTAREAAGALRAGAEVHLQLAEGLNHALFVHIHPDAPAGAVERLDVAGGSGLIRTLAGVEPLAALGELVQQTVRARVSSPPPMIYLWPAP